MLKLFLFFMILIILGIIPEASLSSEPPSQLIGEGNSFFHRELSGT
jgi:hypothetical protein